MRKNVPGWRELFDGGDGEPFLLEKREKSLLAELAGEIREFPKPGKQTGIRPLLNGNPVLAAEQENGSFFDASCFGRRFFRKIRNAIFCRGQAKAMQRTTGAKEALNEDRRCD